MNSVRVKVRVVVLPSKGGAAVAAALGAYGGRNRGAGMGLEEGGRGPGAARVLIRPPFVVSPRMELSSGLTLRVGQSLRRSRGRESAVMRHPNPDVSVWG